MLSRLNIFKRKDNEILNEKLAAAEKQRAYNEALEQHLRQWQESEIGRYFEHRLNQTKEAAKHGLTTVKPTDVEKVTELQNTVRMCSMAQRFFAEILMHGKT